MGSVYLATDNVLTEEDVAIKILHTEFVHDRRHTQRFLREVQLMRKVNHPNVVRTYDVGADNATVYFTMEFVPGQTLEDIMEAGTFDVELLPTLITQLCEGLAAIHEQNIIHRDLKPGNIMLLDDGTVKITDFGVARPTVSTLTDHNEIIGSSCYMAPEIWIGNKISSSVDLYGLGVILYELTTGELPFDAESPAALMRLHCETAPIPPSDHNPTIQPWLERLILKLLEKSPLDRPRSAHDVIDYLKSEIEKRTITLTNEAVLDKHGPKKVSHTFIAKLEEITRQSTQSNKAVHLDTTTNPSKKRKNVMTSSGVRGRTMFGALWDQLGALFFTLALTTGILGILYAGHLALFDSAHPNTLTNWGGQFAEVSEAARSLSTVLVTKSIAALLHLLVASVPAFLLGALIGSFRHAVKLFTAAFVFHTLSALALLFATLMPIVSSRGMTGVSLYSASSFAGQRIGEIALLSPVVSVTSSNIQGGHMIHSLVSNQAVVFLPLPSVLLVSYVLLLMTMLHSGIRQRYENTGSTATYVGSTVIGLVAVESLIFGLDLVSPDMTLQTYGLAGFVLTLPAFCWAVVSLNWLVALLLTAVLVLRRNAW